MNREHCHYLLSSLSDYMDGDLSEELCIEIERHLANCDNCRIVVDSLQKTIDLYQATTSNPTLPTDVRDRLYHRLNLDDFVKKEVE